MSANVKRKAVPYSEKAEVKTLTNTLAAMQKTWILLYERYKDGKISREDFLLEKKKYDEETVRLELRLKELQNSHQEQKQQEMEHINELLCYADQMEFTEEIKEMLIDKVKVFSDNRIEIFWKFESGFANLETMYKCG